MFVQCRLLSDRGDEGRSQNIEAGRAGTNLSGRMFETPIASQTKCEPLKSLEIECSTDSDSCGWKIEEAVVDLKVPFPLSVKQEDHMRNCK